LRCSSLLAAGVALSAIIRAYPLASAWLTAKLLALIAYSGAGRVAAVFSRDPVAGWR